MSLDGRAASVYPVGMLRPLGRRRDVDVAQWLRSLGLAQYEQAFRDNAVDADTLPRLTSDDLKELVGRPGRRPSPKAPERHFAP